MPESLSPADAERLRALRVMKTVALGGLLAMAALFVVGFLFQQRIPAMAYVRAAGEGGMVGALADWFAVTALFRHPLGIPIPHTAIIPKRKDEIGRSLGEFVEENFLSGEIVRGKLAGFGVSARLGAWLADERNAERLAGEGAALSASVLRALSDDDVQDLVATLAHDHLISPEWAPNLGQALERLVETDAHRPAIDLAADSLHGWLAQNKASFDGFVSGRLPSWVPSIAHRLVDDTVYREAVAFVNAVRERPDHTARRALDRYLARLAESLQHDPETIARFEGAKLGLFDSPRTRSLAASAWESAKASLLTALADPESALRTRAREALVSAGARLAREERLAARIDAWVSDAAAFAVERYRHDIASIITDTIERWDAAETTQKIELMVGRDLQYIRLNGTIVGALAGVAIYAVAHALLGAFGGIGGVGGFGG